MCVGGGGGGGGGLVEKAIIIHVCVQCSKSRHGMLPFLCV